MDEQGYSPRYNKMVELVDKEDATSESNYSWTSGDLEEYIWEMKPVLSFPANGTNMDVITSIINPDSDACLGIECDGKVVTLKIDANWWNAKHNLVRW